jgi:hypothetical protein
MTGEPHDDLDVLLIEDDHSDALKNMQIALFGVALPTLPPPAAGVQLGGSACVLPGKSPSLTVTETAGPA